METLLFLNKEFTEKQTDVVFWISLVAVVALIALVVIFCINSKKSNDAKIMVYESICLALSFALSYIKVGMPYGGSITPASFLPVLIFAYAFGFKHGLFCGFIYGILQFISDPYIYTPMQFLLDYPLAFATIGLMGLARFFGKNRTARVVIGASLVFVARLTMHVLSGIIFFKAGWIVEGLPASNAFIYSLCYNASYLVPDAIICVGVLVALCLTGSFDRLLNSIKSDKKVVYNQKNTELNTNN